MSKPAPDLTPPAAGDILANVRAALNEDVGSGDITAGLIPAGNRASGTVITREAGVLCGAPWVDAVFAELGGDVTIEWHAADGDTLSPDDTLFTFAGDARTLLTGERTALNFLQLLSGTASACARRRVVSSSCEPAR